MADLAEAGQDFVIASIVAMSHRLFVGSALSGKIRGTDVSGAMTPAVRLHRRCYNCDRDLYDQDEHPFRRSPE
jgi:hypothetical protein